ncbi:protein FAM174C-like [Petaurus breviceps papuanus]|uniref:protein FAM174C-like n=1 Tax=Petaurus breviceps papuanus TaxID=3040969 RepID=UPI0036DA7363
MVGRFLLLVLLFRAWPWAWASKMPLAPAASWAPRPSARVVTDSPSAVMANVNVSSNGSQAINASQSHPVLNTTQWMQIQKSLIMLTGCSSLVALYFVVWPCRIKNILNLDERQLTHEDHQELASMDSDEETVYEARLNQ